MSISHILTFPKISLMLFPEGDITFFSGDLVSGSESSSSVAGFRHESPPPPPRGFDPELEPRHPLAAASLAVSLAVSWPRSPALGLVLAGSGSLVAAVSRAESGAGESLPLVLAWSKVMVQIFIILLFSSGEEYNKIRNKSSLLMV